MVVFFLSYHEYRHYHENWSVDHTSCSCNWFILMFTQRVTILQTVSNQEVTQERLISMLRIAQKLYVGA